MEIGGVEGEWLAFSVSSGRRGVDQLGVGVSEVALIGVARGHGEFDATYAGANQRPDFQELQADHAAGRFGELGVLQSQAAQRAEQHISPSRQTTAAAGWRALSLLRCGRQTD